MLVATPFSRRDFDLVAPPRVISGVVKKTQSRARSARELFCLQQLDFKPKLTGDLLVKTGAEHKWSPRRVVIRGGQLHISDSTCRQGSFEPLRIPLRDLSLQAGPLTHSLSLCREQLIILTLQMSSEDAFDLWVKTIAIELIRQTPLEAVKYLDIFTFAKCWRSKSLLKNNAKPLNCDSNNNTIKTTISQDCNSNDFVDSPATPLPSTNSQCMSCSNSTPPPRLKIDRFEIVDDLENIFKKCQNSETYVPVKEKLILFESLGRLGRKVRSTEDVSSTLRASSGGEAVGTTTTKRARSLHDLSNLPSHKAVREICRYFEIKSGGLGDMEEPVSMIRME